MQREAAPRRRPAAAQQQAFDAAWEPTIGVDIGIPAPARRIKTDPALRAIPIIAVTSYALSGDDQKALAAGCDAYVTKPFSPRALLGKVREYLG